MEVTSHALYLNGCFSGIKPDLQAKKHDVILLIVNQCTLTFYITKIAFKSFFFRKKLENNIIIFYFAFQSTFK